MGPALSALFSLALVGSSGLADQPRDPPKSAATAAASSSSNAVPTAAGEAREKRERQARAVEFHNEAKALYERGLYRRAIAKLEAAVALDPEGKEIVYNLALIHEKLAEADVAEKYYRRYVEMETDAKARDKALVIVKRLEGAKQKLKDDLQERAATVVSPTASASASAPGTAVAPRKAVPLPSPMVFIIGGVAVAAVGVGIGFGVSALGMYPASPTTGRGVPVADLETRARAAHTQAVVSDFALATSFVSGAAAAVLYLLETRAASSPAPPPPAVAPRLSRGPRRIEVPF